MKAFALNLIGAVIAILALTAPAKTQEYPAKPIHIIVGFAAGGGNDIIARVFGQKLSPSRRRTATRC
jgi:tripartite-type tricarboxylate transporter receptor subunit TctC